MGGTENVPKITYVSHNIQKLSSILGKVGSNDGISGYFLENKVIRGKIEILGGLHVHLGGICLKIL